MARRLQSVWPEREGPAPDSGLRARLRPRLCRDLLVQNALYTGDLERLRRLLPWGVDVDLVIEVTGPEHGEWPGREGILGGAPHCGRGCRCGVCTFFPVTARFRTLGQWDDPRMDSVGRRACCELYRCVTAVPAAGIWSLCYRQEFTSPLHICSSRGFQLCVQYLLSCGALPDLCPGGKTALHEACENAQGECVRLLLNGGANPNARSEDGYCPLHLCTAPESLQCAQYLLASGASVNSRTEEREDSALHFAARFGLELHVELYLGAGAGANGVNGSGQTPLHCVCAQPHGRADAERYHRVCRRLLDSGAAVRTLDSEQQSPLHLACSTANHRNVDMLLGRGADTNRMDYGGNAPLHNALQAVNYRLHMEPERTVRALLNHGSIRIWPGAMPKVLKYCSVPPRTIEVLANVYDRLKVTDDWIRAVPPEVLQEHGAFYSSVWALRRQPRSLPASSPAA
ncbi:LOW QUALITY PROTEIN: ankyrin repeat and SOCS box protein 10-like [Leucoraja erinacea]|uniref:LOW QUALITY PROTEIN: ankyrin repeat and SOCS box protein 10-like n=1 Tax=Leucoraja erinaceus TaxID=7782 RepID=UPI00245455ED|nr:LOW QUALITY PROTEIN: ankyrin repeat and SOCS box protein 10-like [Leucoraja erinacea]